jgi:hypothetical protein
MALTHSGSVTAEPLYYYYGNMVSGCVCVCFLLL